MHFDGDGVQRINRNDSGDRLTLYIAWPQVTFTLFSEIFQHLIQALLQNLEQTSIHGPQTMYRYEFGNPLTFAFMIDHKMSLRRHNYTWQRVNSTFHFWNKTFYFVFVVWLFFSLSQSPSPVTDVSLQFSLPLDLQKTWRSFFWFRLHKQTVKSVLKVLKLFGLCPLWHMVLFKSAI